jgi:hypothetical protein
MLGADVGNNFKGDPLYRYQKKEVPVSQSYLTQVVHLSP